MPPISLAEPTGRHLSFEEREEIAILRAQGAGVRAIARTVGRDPGTISRELRRNAATRSGKKEYRATVAQWKAQEAARRPKAAKMVANPRLREYVQERLAGHVRLPDGTAVTGPVAAPWKGLNKPHRQDRRWSRAWSPEQIADRLAIFARGPVRQAICGVAANVAATTFSTCWALIIGGQPAVARRADRPSCRPRSGPATWRPSPARNPAGRPRSCCRSPWRRPGQSLNATPTPEPTSLDVTPRQFGSKAFRRELETYRLAGSMGQVGSSADNAAMESFFALPWTLGTPRWSGASSRSRFPSVDRGLGTVRPSSARSLSEQPARAAASQASMSSTSSTYFAQHLHAQVLQHLRFRDQTHKPTPFSGRDVPRRTHSPELEIRSSSRRLTESQAVQAPVDYPPYGRDR